MINFIHRFLNPHCEHCIIEDERKFQQSSFNPVVEYLKDEVARLQRLNDNLTAQLLDSKKPETEITGDTTLTPPKPVRPIRAPWMVKQKELEAEDRNKARVLRKLAEDGVDIDKPMPLADLEKEIEAVKERLSNAG